jgi:uncharacterized membrane protein
VTPPRGWALAARPASGYRRAWVRERLADTFWPVPALLLAVGVVLAGIVARAGSLGLDGLLQVGPPVSAGETSNVLGIIASSTLTFLGVVFTLTLVALQLASSQLSPRVVRMFVRSGVTKLAFGLLLAAFSYCVAFLVLEGGQHRADSAGLTVAMALVTASLIVFLGYVATTMRLLQVAWVITRVADETRASITANTPSAAEYRRAARPELAADPELVTLVTLGRRRRLSPGVRQGVLQGVDHRRLVRLAARHDCVLELLVRVGEYVPAGAAVIAVHPGAGQPPGPAPAGPPLAGPPLSAILAGLSLGRTRTVYQDPSFGLRQLVDIAIQALSAAINQPTTAVQVIDRMEDLILRIGRLPDRTGSYADAAGRIRVQDPVMTWDEILDLTFSEITSCGAGSTQVTRRLLALYDAVEAALPAGRRPAVAARRDALLQESADQGVPQAGLHADALGLG